MLCKKRFSQLCIYFLPNVMCTISTICHIRSLKMCCFSTDGGRHPELRHARGRDGAGGEVPLPQGPRTLREQVGKKQAQVQSKSTATDLMPWQQYALCLGNAASNRFKFASHMLKLGDRLESDQLGLEFRQM